MFQFLLKHCFLFRYLELSVSRYSILTRHIKDLYLLSFLYSYLYTLKGMRCTSLSRYLDKLKKYIDEFTGMFTKPSFTSFSQLMFAIPVCDKAKKKCVQSFMILWL